MFADISVRIGLEGKKVFIFLFDLIVYLFAVQSIEPGTAGSEARTLPLCYAVPPGKRSYDRKTETQN